MTLTVKLYTVRRYTVMIISVISYKGGTAKTVTALHLAGCLARNGRVLVADGDLNRSAIEWAERGDGALPFRVCAWEGLAMEQSRNSYRHIILDTPARPEPKRLKGIVEGCDRLILTTTPDAVSLAALRPAIADLFALQADFCVLLTMTPPTGHVGLFAQRAFIEQKFPVYKTLIRRFAAYQKAALNGRLVCDVSDDYAAAGWDDYQRLSREVLKK